MSAVEREKKRRKGPRFRMLLVVEGVCRNPGAVTSVRETGKVRCEISAMLATAVGAERREQRQLQGFVFPPKVENPGARAHWVEKVIIVGPLGSEAFEKNPAESHSEHVRRAKSLTWTCLCLCTCWFPSTAERARPGRRTAHNLSFCFQRRACNMGDVQ